MMADQEKDTLARALEPFARMLSVWAPRREMPVITGRMIVAVAVTVEMGNEKARILYRIMLRYHQLCQHGIREKKGYWERTRQRSLGRRGSMYVGVSQGCRILTSPLTAGTRKERACIDERIFGVLFSVTVCGMFV